MNKSVNFEIAKLLKEKGFDTIDCDGYYHVCDGYTKGYSYCYSDVNTQKEDAILAPTIAEVVMWMYEKHGVWIYVKQGYNWEWFIETISNKPELIYNDGLENSPTEAYEAAITYTLENLMQGGNNEQ
jgi:hypothetical protein